MPRSFGFLFFRRLVQRFLRNRILFRSKNFHSAGLKEGGDAAASPSDDNAAGEFLQDYGLVNKKRRTGVSVKNSEVF